MIHEHIKQREEKFQEGMKELYNNGNPYWPNWDAVRAFNKESAKLLLEEVIKKGDGELKRYEDGEGNVVNFMAHAPLDSFLSHLQAEIDKIETK